VGSRARKANAAKGGAKAAVKISPDVRRHLGREIGGYKIVEHLASGGMAEIYLATKTGSTGFHKELVVKLLQSRFADNPDVVRMFRDEARIGAKLNHPNIVDVYDAGDQQGVHFIAMEHIDGRTLTELVRRGLQIAHPLPRNLAAEICGQVAEALSYMHDDVGRDGEILSVVHRDISPTNIIITDRGHTKVIDFGIATDLGDKKEESEARPGKYAYMSPEQVMGRQLDGRSDVFSLGIMLYEITLGKRLYRGKPQVVMKRIVEDRVRPPTFIEKDYPPALELIVMRALEKDPSARYAHAGLLARDLAKYLSEQDEATTHRHVARHLEILDAPDAVVSETGQRAADAFGDEGSFDDEPLNLEGGDADTAAWRVAGPEPDDDGVRGDDRPAPAPGEGPAGDGPGGDKSSRSWRLGLLGWRRR